jgi:hypothetical protein
MLMESDQQERALFGGVVGALLLASGWLFSLRLPDVLCYTPPWILVLVICSVVVSGWASLRNVRWTPLPVLGFLSAILMVVMNNI